jgi:hypothetical protein
LWYTKIELAPSAIYKIISNYVICSLCLNDIWIITSIILNCDISLLNIIAWTHFDIIRVCNLPKYFSFFSPALINNKITSLRFLFYFSLHSRTRTCHIAMKKIEQEIEIFVMFKNDIGALWTRVAARPNINLRFVQTPSGENHYRDEQETLF